MDAFGSKLGQLGRGVFVGSLTAVFALLLTSFFDLGIYITFGLHKLKELREEEEVRKSYLQAIVTVLCTF